MYDASIESKQTYERSGLQCLKSILVWRSLVVECILPGISVWRGAFVYAFLHLKHDFPKECHNAFYPGAIGTPGFFALRFLGFY